jgi:gliding motility-associated protein GldE
MLLLVFVSALISGSEIAFFSLNPVQLKALKSEKNKVNNLILNLLERPKRLLATILIANNFVNVAIVILSTYIIAGTFNLNSHPLLAFTIQVVVVTSLLLIFGEIMPKIYSAVNPVSFAKLMARPIQVMIRVFYPLSILLVKSSNIIDKRIRKKGGYLSMSELSEAIDLTSDADTPEEERKILKGIVKFSDIDVKEIMKSRVDVTAVDISTSYTKLLSIILDCGYSRIPTFEDSFDNIAGILYVKDLLPHLDKGDEFRWQKLLRPAFFVPENKKINDLLQEFQQKKIHLSIVVDEYGGTSGIVTLEDIIEEIVGEISDEFDTEDDEVSYTKINDKTYLFDGKTLINDFCKVLEIDDKIFEEVKGDSETLAGLILEVEGKIPKVNETSIIKGFEFKVKKANRRRIEEVLVKILS